MNPEEIAAILQKAISGAIKPETKTDDNANVEAIGNIAKAVQAIATKVESLEKDTVKVEKETPETAISKITETLATITKAIEEIKNPIAEEDKPVDMSKMTKKELTELLKGILKPAKETPTLKGKGKETQKSILDSADDEEEEIDLSNVETHDVAGNELTKSQRIARKSLDDVLGVKLTGVLQKQGLIEDDTDDADDTEETEE